MRMRVTKDREWCAFCPRCMTEPRFATHRLAVAYADRHAIYRHTSTPLVVACS